MGDAAPLAVLADQRQERLRVPAVERVDGCPQLVDHSLMVNPLDANRTFPGAES